MKIDGGPEQSQLGAGSPPKCLPRREGSKNTIRLKKARMAGGKSSALTPKSRHHRPGPREYLEEGKDPRSPHLPLLG